MQLDEIRQMEVVKGPGSALFGFNAVSGVVNIITFNPKYDARNVATVRLGDHGQKIGSLVATHKFGSAISARLSVGAEERDEWARTGALPLASPLHDPHRVTTALDVVAQLTPKTELRVEGSWANVQESLVTGSSYANIKMATASAKTTLTSDTGIGQIQAQAHQNQLRSKYNLGGRRVLWNNTITVVSLQDLFKICAAHTIRLSGEYRHNTLNTAPLVRGDVSYDVWSGSAMWNWAISDTLTTTAAIRVDKLLLERSGVFPARIPLANNAFWDRSSTEPSVNLTAAWRPTAKDTVRLSYARGVQAPSLIQFGGLQLDFGPVYIIGNPNLKPATVDNYEVAYDRDPAGAKLGGRLFAQPVVEHQRRHQPDGPDLSADGDDQPRLEQQRRQRFQNEGSRADRFRQDRRRLWLAGRLHLYRRQGLAAPGREHHGCRRSLPIDHSRRPRQCRRGLGQGSLGSRRQPALCQRFPVVRHHQWRAAAGQGLRHLVQPRRLEAGKRHHRRGERSEPAQGT
ncbi:TonB-dependent receptor plug domain-containing protein [Caulobacter sp. DWR1-3-2b1]|uniref:TonB-dependent receptor plug domain-containing protein n=1 Tax=Caulobacter sp. DWR1-3-2b1 TaxID=2804670 RepID=UPI003CF98372